MQTSVDRYCGGVVSVAKCLALESTGEIGKVVDWLMGASRFRMSSGRRSGNMLKVAGSAWIYLNSLVVRRYQLVWRRQMAEMVNGSCVAFGMMPACCVRQRHC